MKHSTTQPQTKLCFILGTRPEIIKLAPLILECEARNIPYRIIHTGQHYSEQLNDVFLRDLGITTIHHNIAVGSATHGAQTGAMLQRIEAVLIAEGPDMVIVQGDTNSVLSGALAAAKLNIPVAHVEGGLRSYDRTMPEEINRVVTGAVAALHFVPTQGAAKNLLREGIHPDCVHVVGNTIVDAVLGFKDQASKRSKLIAQLGLADKSYSLITIHRPENTDFPDRLHTIFASLTELATTHDLQLVWPMHPRTKAKIDSFGMTDALHTIPNLHLLEPVTFFDLLALQQHSRVTLTDSGGIQEESCILKVPCVTIRNNTERPESIEVGANYLAGCDTRRILAGAHKMLGSSRAWQNPFGDGTTATQILDIITEHLAPVQTPAPSQTPDDEAAPESSPTTATMNQA